MKIEICDMCKEVPNTDLQICRLIRFEAREDIFGKPRKVMNLCEKCFNKIFPPNYK